MEHGQRGRKESRQSRSALVRADYQDPDGRWWATMVPVGENIPAEMGIPIGPPDLTPLGLPEDISVALHNQLFHRGLLTQRDIRGRGKEVFASLQAALKVSATSILALYR